MLISEFVFNYVEIITALYCNIGYFENQFYIKEEYYMISCKNS